MRFRRIDLEQPRASRSGWSGNRVRNFLPRRRPVPIVHWGNVRLGSTWVIRDPGANVRFGSFSDVP